jgi:hypothetical protein
MILTKEMRESADREYELVVKGRKNPEWFYQSLMKALDEIDYLKGEIASLIMERKK